MKRRKKAENACRIDHLRAFNEKFRSFSVKNASFLQQQKKILKSIYSVLKISNPVFLCAMKTEEVTKANKMANLYAYYDLKTLFIYLVFFPPLSLFSSLCVVHCAVLCCCR